MDSLLQDGSTPGHNGIKAMPVNGAIHLVNGIKGSALDFTKQGNYVSFGTKSFPCLSNPDLCENGYTAALWVKQKRHTSAWAGLLGYGDDPITIAHDRNGVKLNFRVTLMAGKSYYTNVYFENDYNDKWYHYALTWHQKHGIRSFKNGIRYGLGANPYNRRAPVGTDVKIGYGKLNATIDDVYIWEDYKTDDFIWMLYAGLLQL